ncbi:hypothetical protein WA158_003550 [Blastocystis sp. Blastoise]
MSSLGTIINDKLSMASSSAGALYLKRYVNPCDDTSIPVDGVPDGQTHMIYTLNNKFNISIDQDTFVDPRAVVPDLYNNFTIIATPWSTYPILIYGTFTWYNTVDKTSSSQTCIMGVKDPNWQQNQEDFNLGRGLFRGCTLKWAGNTNNMQGLIYGIQVPYCVDTMYTTSGSVESQDLSYKAFNSYMNPYIPLDSNAITSYSPKYKVFNVPDGCYMPQHLSYGYKNYYRPPIFQKKQLDTGDSYEYFINGLLGSASAQMNIFDYDTWMSKRIFTKVMLPIEVTEYVPSFLHTGFNFGIIRVEGSNFNNPFTLKICNGYELVPSYNSEYFPLLKNPPLLDEQALYACAILTQSLDFCYPSSYNDFQTMWNGVVDFWNKFKRSWNSETVQNIATAASAIPGVSPWVQGINTLTKF